MGAMGVGQLTLVLTDEQVTGVASKASGKSTIVGKP